jgi:hypothetical protein
VLSTCVRLTQSTNTSMPLHYCFRLAAALVILIPLLTFRAKAEESALAPLRSLIGHSIDITEKSTTDGQVTARWKREYAIEGISGCTLLLRVKKSFTSEKSGSRTTDDLYTIPFGLLDEKSTWLDEEGNFEKAIWEPHLYVACSTTRDYAPAISVATDDEGRKITRDASSFCISFITAEAASRVVHLMKDAAAMCR